MKTACPTCGAEVEFRYDDSFVRVCAHCRAAGLSVQKIPEQLELVDVLPRNASGKILKYQLQERYRR